MIEIRFCTLHQDYLPVGDFYISSKGYYSSYCKTCQKKKSRERYADNPLMAEQQKEYVKNRPKNYWKKRYARYRKKRLKFYQDNKKRISAQNLARYYKRILGS